MRETFLNFLNIESYVLASYVIITKLVYSSESHNSKLRKLFEGEGFHNFYLQLAQGCLAETII